MITLIASIVLSAVSLFDGITTARFLKNPEYEEQNFLLGKRPSKLRIYGEGGLIIAGEIAIGFALSHVSILGYLIAVGFGFQSFVHVRNGIRNLKIPV